MSKTLLEILDLTGEKNILQEMEWDKKNKPLKVNTKMKKSELLKDRILSLHNEGMCNKDICKELGTSPATVCVMLKLYKKEPKKEGYFDVDELDCWIFPSESKLEKYDSK